MKFLHLRLCTRILRTPRVYKNAVGMQVRKISHTGPGGTPGSGAGKGGGAGGSVRESGGGLGKYAAAQEELYFDSKNKEQLRHIKSKLDLKKDSKDPSQKK